MRCPTSIDMKQDKNHCFGDILEKWGKQTKGNIGI